jgi:hypothetical protein
MSCAFPSAQIGKLLTIDEYQGAQGQPVMAAPASAAAGCIPGAHSPGLIRESNRSASHAVVQRVTSCSMTG